MNELYSGRIRAGLSNTDFSLSIEDFDDSLNIERVGARITIADKIYNLGTVTFGRDEQAFRAVLSTLHVNPNMVTVFGKNPDPLTNHISTEKFSEVTLDQLIAAGLLVFVRRCTSAIGSENF